ncbi:MAG: tripartite tricarboxylate transporter substrate binding protein [Burkholderiaceae bacterium]
MDSNRRTFAMSMVGLAVGAASRSASAEPAQTWPSRPVTLVTPFPPGAGSDYLRLLAEKLTDSFGKPFIVDNRPGATGVIGTQLVANAKPDGYTFLMGSNSSHVIAPMLLEKKPYDPITDFEPISMIMRYPLVLVVTPTLPFESITELIGYAVKNPGKLNYASIGQGSGTHLAAEWFKHEAGVDIVHVPYKGVAQAQTAVMSGEVQMWFDGPRSALQFVRTGRLRALAVTGPERVPALPDVATMKEAGLPSMDPRIWIGLFAPKGTPRPILDRLGDEVRRVVRVPQVRTFIEAEGTAEVVGGSPTQLAEYIRKEAGDWKALIDKLGIRLE